MTVGSHERDPEIRTIFWDVGGVILTNGWDIDQRARVLTRLTAVEQHRGKRHEVRSIVQMQARLAAGAFRGLRNYRPFAFQW